MIDQTRTATRSPCRRKAAAWVVLSALLFNLAAGYVLPSTAQAALAQADIADSLSSGVLVICTPNGLRVIRSGPDGEPLPDQHQQDARCVYCLPFNMAQAGLASALTVETVPLLTAERITYPVDSHASSSGGSSDRHPIRAPPNVQ